MSQLFRRIRYLLNRRRFDRELAGDMEFHREMAARAGAREGARTEAARESFGNPLLLREQARDAWGWTWIDRLFQDLRYAARMLRKSPAFTAVAVLMLALGIGVNLAAFGFFDLMFLRPLPVRDPATLLRFDRASPQGYSDNFMYPEVAFYREHSKTVSAVLALSDAKLTIEGEQNQLNANFVTANFFSELGATPKLGRMLDRSQDEASGAEPVVVLDELFWQRHFHADPSIVGKTIRLNTQPAIIIGVASSEFSGLGWDRPALWAPINQEPYFVKGSRLTDFADGGIGVFMWGRLRAGIAPEAAGEELKSLAAELHRQYPKDVMEKESLPTKPGGYAETVGPEMVPVFALVAALGLLILAAACGNLGSLLLARGVAREREIAIRVAVGAGRGRLIRQLFTESLSLALLGSVAGLALGYVVLRLLMVWAEAPTWLDATPDRRVMAFAIGMGFAAAILFGLTPAWQASRQRHRATITRQFLIGAQVAASCVLLIVAGLLVRALNRAMFANQGFEHQHVVSIDPHFHGYSPDAARAYLDAFESRLRALPGVAAVSMASNPPLGNRWTVGKTKIAGHPVSIHYNHVDPPFFQTMQIPLLRGRNLMPGDTREAVVSESLARIEWPAEDPVGKLFRSGADTYPVVGVVGSARLVSPEDSDAVEVYQLASGDIMPSMVVLVRTHGPPEELVSSVASIAKSIDPGLFPEVQLMKSAFRGKLRIAGYSALAVGLLGLIALLLACAGIVGLVAYGVSQRTKEIGIRMALGARPAHVLAVILRQFSVPVAAGLLAGVGAAAALSQILRQLLYGVGNLDPIAYLGAIAVFAVTVAVAALLPARRALRVDPMRALRYE
jgi:predicted permease